MVAAEVKKSHSRNIGDALKEEIDSIPQLDGDFEQNEPNYCKLCKDKTGLKEVVTNFVVDDERDLLVKTENILKNFKGCSSKFLPQMNSFYVKYVTLR